MTAYGNSRACITGFWWEKGNEKIQDFVSVSVDFVTGVNQLFWRRGQLRLLFWNVSLAGGLSDLYLLCVFPV